MTEYWKPVDEGLIVSCLNCGPEQRKYLGDHGLSPGLGMVSLNSDELVIASTHNATRAIIRNWKAYVKAMVSLNSSSLTKNYFIELETPMRGSRWTYDGKCHWVLTHTSMGFA